jgi:hypothetical protein
MSARGKASSYDHRGKMLKPSPRSLLKAITRATKVTDHTLRDRIPKWWTHVNILTQLTIKKDILHIKLRDGPFPCHRPLLRLLCLLLVVRVLVFTVITVVEMDMWRHSTTGRRKLRRLRLVVLHRVLVVLVLEDLRGVMLVQRHRRFSCCFVALRPLCHQELLVL